MDVGYSNTTVAVLKAGKAGLEKTKSTEEGEEGPSGDVEMKAAEDSSPSKSKTGVVVEAEIVAVKSVSVGVVDFINSLTEAGLAFAKNKHNEVVSMKSKKGFKLKTAMQKSLKELSMLPEADVVLECWPTEDIDFKMNLQRNDLESKMEGPLGLIEACVKSVCDEAKSRQLEGASFDYVEIVGGGVRIPCVAERICKGIECAPETLGRGLDGSSAVASGACLRATGTKFFESRFQDNSSIMCAGEKKIVDFAQVEVDAAKVSTESQMQQIEDLETARLAALNKFESYLYEAKNWVKKKRPK